VPLTILAKPVGVGAACQLPVRVVRERARAKGGYRTLSKTLLSPKATRDGIDNWHLIPSSLRRSIGRRLAPVRSGSGVIEKNIEVRIARRFKRQGRSWTRNGAEHLANCSGSRIIPPIGPTGGAKPL